MRTAGIICEYNPFHAGHRLQLAQTRSQIGQDSAILCLMSGNYVQRGEPAIYSKELRAEAAIRNGADLVLELPLTIAINAAGWFADGAVDCMEALGCVDYLSFGSESGSSARLTELAGAITSPEFEMHLREALLSGKSYPSARSRALDLLGYNGDLLRQPNNALGVDYICALKRRNSRIQPLVIERELSLPSASVLREALLAGEREQLSELPEAQLYTRAPMHGLAFGERAMLAVLRSLPQESFRDMPFRSEGLWSKVMKACRTQRDLEAILNACKSKRYTHSRLRRMLLCLFLGLSEADMHREIPYLRVLAFNDRGRQLLRNATKNTRIPLVSGAIPKTDAAQAFFALEDRAANLYPLFEQEKSMVPIGQERARHPVYIRGNNL